MSARKRFGLMPFFKITLIAFFMMSTVFAVDTSDKADIKTAIISTASGSCETNNLMFSAMKFYKIPLNEKYENYDVYLRVILFFAADQSLSLRLTKQALLGCQTTSSGEELCSFRPLEDQWSKRSYHISENILIPGFGDIELSDPTNLNRGFNLTFHGNFPGQTFPGGMVLVNFNHEGKNTAFICK